ncbi:MAG: radical SAM family heme chaperone HemW [Bacteroidetes bacterium]|nr:radical SAM family heme chaperone HemW [Bacteroidota bacterium]
MSALYIHIPFCKKACHYCNFHFSTSLQYKNELIQQLLKEIEIRKDYLQHKPLETIYFGGGTPSLLTDEDLILIFEAIHRNCKVSEGIEITLEANPDDLSNDKLTMLKQVGINRLSIGIQSFFEEDLLYMNRSHNAKQAKQCLEDIQVHGFSNFSADLIFGYPLLSDDKWKQNIETMLHYNVPHLSCYAMTIEPQTALDAFIKKKQSPALDNAQSATQFEYLMKVLASQGYEHYEISNYAKPNHRAIHNSNYWKGKSYLGIGPSAHSFNGESRQWNVSNNMKYIKSLQAGIIPFEIEILESHQKLNELIMISLRTKEGLSSQLVKSKIDPAQWKTWQWQVQQFIDEGLLSLQTDTVVLSTKGKLFADYIAAQLFVDEFI